jgi:hypothetical protein
MSGVYRLSGIIGEFFYARLYTVGKYSLKGTIKRHGDTLLKIAVTFSSVVVKPLHELLLSNSEELKISLCIQHL